MTNLLSIRKLTRPAVAGLVLASMAFAGHSASASPLPLSHSAAVDPTTAPLLPVQYYPGYGYGPRHHWWRHEMWRRHFRHERWRYEHRYGYGYGGRY